jgi:hypothetical protein
MSLFRPRVDTSARSRTGNKATNCIKQANRASSESQSDMP